MNIIAIHDKKIKHIPINAKLFILELPSLTHIAANLINDKVDSTIIQNPIEDSNYVTGHPSNKHQSIIEKIITKYIIT